MDASDGAKQEHLLSWYKRHGFEKVSAGTYGDAISAHPNFVYQVVRRRP